MGLFDNVRARNQHSQHHNQQQQRQPTSCELNGTCGTGSVPRNDVRQGLLNNSHPAVLGTPYPTTAPHYSTAGIQSIPSAATKQSSPVSSLNHDEKVQRLAKEHSATNLTTEGVTITRGLNGEVIANIKVSGKSAQIGYVREGNGITATGNLDNVSKYIGDKGKNVSASLNGVYSFTTSANPDGTENFTVTLGKETAGFLLVAGDKQYLIDSKGQAIGAKPEQKATPPTPPSSGSPMTPPPPVVPQNIVVQPPAAGMPPSPPPRSEAPSTVAAAEISKPRAHGLAARPSEGGPHAGIDYNGYKAAAAIAERPDAGSPPSPTPKQGPNWSSNYANQDEKQKYFNQQEVVASIAGFLKKMGPNPLSGLTAEVAAPVPTTGLVAGAKGLSVPLSQPGPSSPGASGIVAPPGSVSASAVAEAAARAPAVQRLTAAQNETEATQKALENKHAQNPKDSEINKQLEDAKVDNQYAKDQAEVLGKKEALFEKVAERVKYLAKQGESGAAEFKHTREHLNTLGKDLGYTAEAIEQAATPQAEAPTSSSKPALPPTAEAIKLLEGEVGSLELSIQSKWQGRLNNALARFKADLPGSEWAKNNPVKALTVGLALTEAASGALKADYSPDAKHRIVPSLIGMLGRDVREWGAFTTGEKGITASIGAEGLRSAGDVTVGVAGFTAAAKVLSATEVGAKLVSRLAVPVAIAATAHNAYASHADGSFRDKNDVQLTGTVASPIAMGAVLGAPFGGPLGAGVGATIGGGVQVAGVATGLAKLDADTQRDYKKQGVRQSLERAEQGFVYPEGALELKGRPSPENFSAEEKEVIAGHAKIAAFSHILKTSKDETLTALGFQKESESATPTERQSIGEANWERMELLTGGRSWYNPTAAVYGNYIDDVKTAAPAAAAEFTTALAQANAYYTDKYQRSMQVAYTPSKGEVSGLGAWGQEAAKNYSFGWSSDPQGYEAGGVTKSRDEFQSYLESHAKEIVKATPADTLKAVEEAFPALNQILANVNTRETLINNLESFTNRPGEFRKILDMDVALGGVLPPE